MKTLQRRTTGPQAAREYVAAEFRAEMARQQLSARALAERMGVSHLWITRRITLQATEITISDVETLADALGRPPAHFIGCWLPRQDSNLKPAGYTAGATAAVVTALPTGPADRDQNVMGFGRVAA